MLLSMSWTLCDPPRPLFVSLGFFGGMSSSFFVTHFEIELRYIHTVFVGDMLKRGTHKRGLRGDD